MERKPERPRPVRAENRIVTSTVVPYLDMATPVNTYGMLKNKPLNCILFLCYSLLKIKALDLTRKPTPKQIH